MINSNSVEVAYIGRDNSIDLELHENGVNLTDYTPISRVLITLGTNVIDSDITPQYLDWTTAQKLIIKAGLAGIPSGNYRARIETFDIDNPDGIVWTESLRVSIRA